LINRIKPGLVNPNHQPKHYLEEHGNINMFLEACVKIGVPNSDLFTLRDVGELKTDLAQVFLLIS
jgi:hypothetical protein